MTTIIKATGSDSDTHRLYHTIVSCYNYSSNQRSQANARSQILNVLMATICTISAYLYNKSMLHSASGLDLREGKLGSCPGPPQPGGPPQKTVKKLLSKET